MQFFVGFMLGGVAVHSTEVCNKIKDYPWQLLTFPYC